MINYDGPRAVFAIKSHPKQALEDIKSMSAAVARLTEERRVLQDRVTELEAARTTDAETINAAWRNTAAETERAHKIAYEAIRYRITDLERELAECRARQP